MEAQQLYLKDGRPAEVWFCGKCRIVHRIEEMANKCCAPRVCKCGETIKEQYYTVCRECRDEAQKQKERARFEAAEKVREWDGWVYCDGTGTDGYSESVDELIERCEDDGMDTPEYAWACRQVDFALVSVADIKDLFDGRECYEDFDPSDMNGWDELESALDSFNAKNSGVVSYAPDYSKAVLIKKGAQ